MRRRAWLGAAILLALLGGPAWSVQISETPFAPLSPSIMAQGGAGIGSAQGWDSFFLNPAGFSRGNGSLTIANTTLWAYLRPDQAMDLVVKMLAGKPSTADYLAFLGSQVTAGGFGLGSSLGMGYVGNGLGLGMEIILDSMAHGATLLGATGDVTGTIGFIGGMSVPLSLLPWLTLHVGGAIRPMIRIHVLADNASTLSVLTAIATGGDIAQALNSSSALYGVGIGLDVGAIAEMGWFTLGISCRDLGGTQFRYSENTLETLSATFSSQGKLPAGTNTLADTYVIPMNLGVGLSVHPDLGRFSGWLDPSVNLDVDDISGLIAGTRTLWTALHVGAQARLLSLFYVQAGINQGYLTVGGGLKVPLLNVSFALFTQELGYYVQDWPRAGATLDISLRL